MRTNRSAWWLSAILPVVVVLAGSELSAATEPFSTIATEPFPTIAQRGIAAPKLDEAIARLPMPPSEPPWFWSSMANDSAYSRYHRRRAVFQLFQRHIHAGMRLSELGALLYHPTWLRASDIVPVSLVAGWVPVHFDPDDSIFVLVVLPEAGKDQSGIYLRITGGVALEEFRSLLLGTGKASIQTEKATIAEIGLCEGGQPCERSRVWRNGLSEYRPAFNDSRPDD